MIRVTHAINGIGIEEKDAEEKKYHFRICKLITGKLNLKDKLKGFGFDYLM